MITRAEILERAASWVVAGVPYSQSEYRAGWRTDCSGYVSYCWDLDGNRWTGNLDAEGLAVARTALLPGDMLLYHNRANPVNGSHVVIFDRWVSTVGGDFWIFEQTPPRARHTRWSATRGRNLANYRPYRPRVVAGVTWSDELMGQLPLLRHGSTGPAVRRLQAVINTRGGPSLDVDGDFGPRTEAAVRAVQASERIQVDGEVGRWTWTALLTD